MPHTLGGEFERPPIDNTGGWSTYGYRLGVEEADTEPAHAADRLKAGLRPLLRGR